MRCDAQTPGVAGLTGGAADRRITLEDLKKISNLTFRATKKDNKEAQVNQTNIKIGRNQIVIKPKCKTLVGGPSGIPGE